MIAPTVFVLTQCVAISFANSSLRTAGDVGPYNVYANIAATS